MTPGFFKVSDQRAPVLRLLSYNIQAGMDTSSYREYLTKGWKNLLPHRSQNANLDKIAHFLGAFDVVGLQEVDGGSLRSGFVNQTGYLACHASFPYWFAKPNRKVGKFAQHSNGLLSRYRPSKCAHHKLPGVPGRGILVCEFNRGSESLVVIVAHLALGGHSRSRQVRFLQHLIQQYPHVVLMGDFNCGCESRDMRYLMANTHLKPSCLSENTFPSWDPVRKIDHILVSEKIEVISASVVDYHLSDHLPVQLDVRLPDTVELEYWYPEYNFKHDEPTRTKQRLESGVS